MLPWLEALGEKRRLVIAIEKALAPRWGLTGLAVPTCCFNWHRFPVRFKCIYAIGYQTAHDPAPWTSPPWSTEAMRKP